MQRLVLILILLATGCSEKSAEPRTIRAHTTPFGNTLHADPALKAERFCSKCHGVALAGGEKSEPSCYQCHGKNWLDLPADEVRAPASHTTNNSGFMHHSSLATPVGTCESCHGEGLLGTGKGGNPSCFLCHAKLWN